jgi:hypothetical protein
VPGIFVVKLEGKAFCLKYGEGLFVYARCNQGKAQPFTPFPD